MQPSTQQEMSQGPSASDTLSTTITIWLPSKACLLWANRGVVGLKHLVTEGRLSTFSELKVKYDLPNWMFFRFLQVRHAFQHHFPGGVTLESDPWSD